MQHGPGPPPTQEAAKRIEARARDVVAQVVQAAARTELNSSCGPHVNGAYLVNPLSGYDATKPHHPTDAAAAAPLVVDVVAGNHARPPGCGGVLTPAAPGDLHPLYPAAPGSTCQPSGAETPDDGHMLTTEHESESGLPHISIGADLMDDDVWYDDRIGAILASESMRRRSIADRMHGAFLGWMAMVWRRKALAARHCSARPPPETWR